MFCLSSGEIKVSAKEEARKESMPYCESKVNPKEFADFTSSTRYGDCIQTEKDGPKDIGKVKIESNGIITISYKYGFTELLVYATVEGTEEAYVIHMSGDKVGDADVKQNTWKSKTMNLSKYIPEEKKVTLMFVYEFAKEPEDPNDKLSVFFETSFCTKGENCEGNVGAGTTRNIKHRIDSFLTSVSAPTSTKRTYMSSTPLVYQGSVTEYVKVDGQNAYVNNYIKMRKPTLIVDASYTNEDTEELETMIKETIIPVLLAILGFAAVITSSVLGWQIVKSADSSQERSEKIARLRTILISLVVVAALLLALGPATDFIRNKLLDE